MCGKCCVLDATISIYLYIYIYIYIYIYVYMYIFIRFREVHTPALTCHPNVKFAIYWVVVLFLSECRPWTLHYKPSTRCSPKTFAQLSGSTIYCHIIQTHANVSPPCQSPEWSWRSPDQTCRSRASGASGKSPIEEWTLAPCRCIPSHPRPQRIPAEERKEVRSLVMNSGPLYHLEPFDWSIQKSIKGQPIKERKKNLVYMPKKTTIKQREE